MPHSARRAPGTPGTAALGVPAGRTGRLGTLPLTAEGGDKRLPEGLEHSDRHIRSAFRLCLISLTENHPRIMPGIHIHQYFLQASSSSKRFPVRTSKPCSTLI